MSFSSVLLSENVSAETFLLSFSVSFPVPFSVSVSISASLSPSSLSVLATRLPSSGGSFAWMIHMPSLSW